MKKIFTCISTGFFLWITASGQQKATIKEYRKIFKTYPFSDPDPIPEVGRIYPYFRFDGYTDSAVQKAWKVVELENEYLKIIILPEVGGKIWSAIEKSTGKSFIYDNHVVKFRDIAMRGPWTSGGIEANYGIIGHTPNCATPVDYTMLTKPDGSVSCVIGVLDLLTRTSWRIDINLPADKAYFTTSSFWYNATPFEQPYYTWMNAGVKAAGNLQFVYPGTKYLGHEGNYRSWPINSQNGKDLSFYRNNDFGGYKSYHVFGKYTDFYGGYWHDEDFGMGRYSGHDDKAGKKIWIWGLSQQGMIWEKLLTDTDGQYVELQSGRLFNQSEERSTRTPFKHKGFLPGATDQWTEYWFPVVKTKGFVAANNYGALNIKNENGLLKIYFSPLQQIDDELTIKLGDKIVYSKKIRLNTLQLFADSLKIDTGSANLIASFEKAKLTYEQSPSANVLHRPVESPADFDWSSVYGLYLQGKEDIRQRDYTGAEEQLKECLKKDPDYSPALNDLSMLYCQKGNEEEALQLSRRALAIDTYDPAANYYYGLINADLGNSTDAKDGFDLASLDIQFRSAAYTALAGIYLREANTDKALAYAQKSTDFNKYAVDAWQVMAVAYRQQHKKEAAAKILDTLRLYDPLNHFVRFENYLWNPSPSARQSFLGRINNEMPEQTFLELALWYVKIGCNAEAVSLLQLSPSSAEVLYWQAYLNNAALDTAQLHPAMVFPFRTETAGVLRTLIQKNNYWLLKYHLALIEWNNRNIAKAKQLFEACGDIPGYAPFYAARAKFDRVADSSSELSDLQKAVGMDKQEWRFGKSIVLYYLSQKQYDRALSVAKEYQSRFPANYILGMLYVKVLILTKEYGAAHLVLQSIHVLPNEGATEGRQLYKQNELMLALTAMGKQQYKKALQYIHASQEWPENLGVGKPYADNIDERLEDWLAYENYTKLRNKKAAQQMADKIITYRTHSEEYGNIFSQANNLVTAWALQQSGNTRDAEVFLKSAVEKAPGNPLAKWALDVFSGIDTSLAPATVKDENYFILQEWIKLKAKGL